MKKKIKKGSKKIKRERESMRQRSDKDRETEIDTESVGETERKIEKKTNLLPYNEAPL